MVWPSWSSTQMTVNRMLSDSYSSILPSAMVRGILSACSLIVFRTCSMAYSAPAKGTASVEFAVLMYEAVMFADIEAAP